MEVRRPFNVLWAPLGCTPEGCPEKSLGAWRCAGPSMCSGHPPGAHRGGVLLLRNRCYQCVRRNDNNCGHCPLACRGAESSVVSRKWSVVSRQSSVVSPQSSVLSRRWSVVGRWSSVISRQSSVVSRHSVRSSVVSHQSVVSSLSVVSGQ